MRRSEGRGERGSESKENGGVEVGGGGQGQATTLSTLSTLALLITIMVFVLFIPLFLGLLVE